MSERTPSIDPTTDRRAGRRASVAGAVAAVVLAAAIFFGSDRLVDFDAALIGYAAATVVLAFGVVYRYAVWVQTAPTRRYLRKGWRAFFSWANFRRFPTMIPRGISSAKLFIPAPRAASSGRSHLLRRRLGAPSR